MARGITQDEVWKACDALLLEGARPTIERVRQRLGRGSPNTVSPMLETWFKHLGARITDPGAFAAPLATPDPVQLAAQHLWEVAQAEARRDLEARVSDGLAAAAANVEAEKEKARIAEAAAFSASSKATHLQAELDQLRAALDGERLSLQATAAQLDLTQRRCVELQDEVAQASRQVMDERIRADQAIATADERAAGAERRAGMEIERERLLRAKADKSTEAIARRFEATLKEQAAATQRWQAADERLLQQQAQFRQREQELQAAAQQQDEQLRELESALGEARLALSRTEAQDDLLAQLMAKLQTNERLVGSSTQTSSKKKART